MWNFIVIFVFKYSVSVSVTGKKKLSNKKKERKLKDTVKETWASIPPQQCHKLITYRRIEAVIKAKGAPTKY